MKSTLSIETFKTEKSVAIVGCGLMGSAIAKTLANANLQVNAWNRSPASASALSEYGIVAFKNINDLIQASRLVIVVLSDYAAVRDVLKNIEPSLWTGQVVVNLTSGSVSDAEQMGQWTQHLAINYLEGSIWTLPSEIGKIKTRITYSGNPQDWSTISSIMMRLGEASVYLGEQISLANIMEAAFPGGFYMTALTSFIEGARVAKSAGVDDVIIRSSIAPALELLRVSIEESIDRIQRCDFNPDQATIKVCLNAARSYHLTMDSLSQNSPLLRALIDTLEKAKTKNFEHLDISALIKT